MKRQLQNTAASLAVLAALTAGAHAEEITITADQWCPYNCEPGSDKPGYVVEIAKRIYEPAGHTINYINMPWDRALRAGADGKVHGVIAVSFQPETEQMVKPEEPLTSYVIQAVTTKNTDWTYNGTDSIGDRVPAVMTNYNYGDAFMAWQEDHPDQQVVNHGDGALERNLQMVERGRADFAIDGANVLRYTLEQTGKIDDFRFAGTIGEAVPLYLGFSKKAGNAEDYAQMWTDGVRKMRANGELGEILTRYGVEDWAE